MMLLCNRFVLCRGWFLGAAALLDRLSFFSPSLSFSLNIDTFLCGILLSSPIFPKFSFYITDFVIKFVKYDKRRVTRVSIFT